MVLLVCLLLEEWSETQAAALAALARLLRNHLGHGAAWFTRLCEFLDGDLCKAE